MTTPNDRISSGYISVLSISPVEEDHSSLQFILMHERVWESKRTVRMTSCETLAAASAVLAEFQFEAVICERDLQPGSWKDVLEQTAILSNPPSLIVTSTLVDDHLFAEALNLGAFDVLAKPFDHTEARLVFNSALRYFVRARGLPAVRERYKVRVAA